MKIIENILGSAGFCIILGAPKRKLIYCIFGIILSAIIYETLYPRTDAFISSLTASAVINVYAEITARAVKTPSTVIALPSTIPLLPGSSLYYGISNLISRNNAQFRYFIGETVQTGLGIALGTLTGIVFVLIIKELKAKI